jgi:surface polysaccharide O-acyltransferase-like enzyme
MIIILFFSCIVINMIQNQKDMLAMGGYLVVNVILFGLAKSLMDNLEGCEKKVVSAGSWLLSITALSLGAALSCMANGCVNHEYALVVLGVFNVLSLAMASWIHANCKEARKHTTGIIVVNVILVAGLGGLVFLTKTETGKGMLGKVHSKLSRYANPSAAPPAAADGAFGYGHGHRF